jgi:hypothetical protein
MIITLDLSKFTMNDFFLLDTKRNIIMDGIFTKIIYSNNWFTMNGLYILFPIEIITIEQNANKRQIKFNPYLPSNLCVIQEFAKLECKIIDYYRQITQSPLKISNMLSKQLYSGYIKIFKEYNKMCNTEENTGLLSNQYVIKISGIWESPSEIGLTYKLFESNENYIN